MFKISKSNLSQNTYFRYAQGLWVYTLVVILWGAWVRISKSGDGCGQSWPLCQGTILPQQADIATWIELAHRTSTGIFSLAVLLLVIMAFRIFPPGHKIRKASLWTLFFTFTEALIGAKLVLSGLVGEVTSFQRLTVMSIHQINSLLLTGSLALSFKSSQPFINKTAYTNIKILILQIGFLVLAITGAIAALSSTLFPSTSLIEGLALDFQKGTHWLLQLRIIHPIFAIIYVSTSLFLLALFKSETKIHYLMLFYVLGFVIGWVNLLMLSPPFMKLIHLTWTHTLWTLLIYWTIPSLKSKTFNK